MSEKKIAANRKNALKSTGPKTPVGKNVSSRNAVKHGILVITPILPGLESQEAWEGHRDCILESLPDNDAEFDAFDRWTAGLLRKAIEVYARAARTRPQTLVREVIASACKNHEEAQVEERELFERGRQWELRLERESRGRMLLEPDVLEKVARYESGLERSLFRTLHELQRLQAARSGAVVPPPAAVDIDLAIHREAT